MTFRAPIRLAVLLAASALVARMVSAAPPSEPGDAHWVASWATAVQAIPELSDPPPLYRAPDVSGRTVREIIYPTLSGERVRVRLSNAYGRTPLVVSSVTLAHSRAGPAIEPKQATHFTFGGRSGVTLAPGQELDSDPAPLDLRAGVRYAVSMHAADGQTVTAWHRVANEVNYVSEHGDHTGDAAPSAFRTRFTAHPWLTGLSVERASGAAIAAIGDSITDGLRSSLSANRRWPDVLASRLAKAGEQSTAVLNLGISGNRLLSDSACYGEAVERRFARDVLARSGVRVAIVLIGINDINFAVMPHRRGLDCDEPHTEVSAQTLIDGYSRLIGAAHRSGVRIWGATLTPAALPPHRESIRTAVNAWIRDSGAFDGVIDFDAALRDAADPARMRRAFDSGDGIHPSDAGYAAMAASIPIERLIAAVRAR